MKIGIDIDDTITDSWNFFIPYYASWFDISEEELRNSKPYYTPIKDKYTVEEYFELVKPLYDSVTSEIPIKDNVKEVIDKIHLLGHEIIFITARGKGYTDSYKLTKEYLDNNGIYYDKLIVNAEHKDIACLSEGIDLFIDDSYRHCKEVSNKGIDVIMMETNYNKDNLEFMKFNNWLDIYEYIKSR